MPHEKRRQIYLNGEKMLRLENITKDYKVADTEVAALRGIDLAFRKSEFVSVLGPSGCGKTTLLNIIGGLDKYTSGEMFINGVSTRYFRDADWDVYRNHRIGFVFQSYNLIPHQTVLGNVELALTIAGVSKAERVKRAKRALDRVGLEGQYYKKPNQLSGGQCQRVAIARALVNEPDILLADEPTGALDTATSIQIMELIKEIAREKLVIMVTHNPELAEKYSTRIIRLLDGQTVDDSNPYSPREEKAEHNVKAESAPPAASAPNQNAPSAKPQKRKQKNKSNKEKAKMSFWTAFRLSAQNLFTKKGRTIMTSVAGAIGIIGVSLVLAISYGVQSYIRTMQNDMLSGNPITIEETTFDMSALMTTMTPSEKKELIVENGFVNVNSLIDSLVQRSGTADNLVITNNITQDYVDFVKGLPSEDTAAVHLDYGLDVGNNIYTDFKTELDGQAQNMSLTAIRTIYTSVLKETKFAQYATYVTNLTQNFRQAPSDDAYVLEQYDLLEGKIAHASDEVMIVVNKNTELTDLLLAQLGYYSQDQFMNLVYKASDDPLYDASLDKDSFSYSELIGRTFVWYPNDEIFSKSLNPFSPFTYRAYGDGLENGVELKVTGILRTKEDISYGCMSAGFYYTEAFAQYAIEQNIDSEIASYLNEQGEKNFTSLVYNGIPTGITFDYSYTYLGETHENQTGLVGTPNAMSALMGSMGGGGSGDAPDEYYTLTLQQLGGINLPSSLAIYPVNFEHKDAVLAYLDIWNSDADIVVNGKTIPAAERDDITYADNLSLVISMINDFIDVVTYALIGFTALSLVVSCVMIGIITYVSVVERTKEIGVIRSLGGRKRDVSYLFNAETFIIGLTSGLIGIGITYILCLIINLIVSSVSVIAAIAVFPWYEALIMVCVSVVLTLLSGLFPSQAAAKKDPVVALRTE